MRYSKLIKSAVSAFAEERVKDIESLDEVCEEHSEEYKEKIASIRDSLMPSASNTNKMTLKRRITIAVCASLIAAMAITACAFFEQIREAVQKIFFKENKTYYQADLGYDNGDITLYEPTWVPEGYELVEHFSSRFGVSKTWICANNKIIYTQSEKGNIVFDSEVSPLIVSNTLCDTIYYFPKENGHFAYWTSENLLFFLSCSGNITYDLFIAILESIDRV